MNLFDVTQGFSGASRDKPRSATIEERNAYLKWIAQRDGITIPADADYQDKGIYSRAAGEYVLLMPGYGQPQLVTCETLDDDGEVIRTMALPQDKRGGIPATAKQVQEWSGLKPIKATRGKTAGKGPIPVRADDTPIPVQAVDAPAADGICAGPLFKGWTWPEALADAVTTECTLLENIDGRISIINTGTGRNFGNGGKHRTRIPARYQAQAMALWAEQYAALTAQCEREIAEATETPEILANAPAQDESAPIAAHDGAEAVEALSEALSGPVEPSGNTGQLIADVLARLADVEARFAGLSAVSTVEAEPAPICIARTPAHERAVRRAWAERKARRAREFSHRMTRDRLENANGSIAYWRDLAEGETMRANRAEQKRRRAVLHARATLSRLRAMRQSHIPTAIAQQALDQAHAKAGEWEASWKIADKDLRDATEHADREAARATVLAAQLAKAGADLTAARRVQTYCDESGRHAPDTIGNTAAHASAAIEKAQGLERQLGEAHAAIARQDKAMDGLADAMEAATLRAIRAETALAAVQAKVSGWPPAVQSVSVRFAA